MTAFEIKGKLWIKTVVLGSSVYKLWLNKIIYESEKMKEEKQGQDIGKCNIYDINQLKGVLR